MTKHVQTVPTKRDIQRLRESIKSLKKLPKVIEKLSRRVTLLEEGLEREQYRRELDQEFQVTLGDLWKIKDRIRNLERTLESLQCKDTHVKASK